MADLPPLLRRISSGQGPFLGFLKEYTNWLKGLKEQQENLAFQKDLLRQLDQFIEDDKVERWIEGKAKGDPKGLKESGK